MKRSPFFLVLFALFFSNFQTGPAIAQVEQAAGTRKVISKVVPAYPDIARTMKLSGMVKLEALVLANGTVKAVEVKGGNPVLVQSAERAVHAWRWEKADHESTEEVSFRFNPDAVGSD